MAQLSPSTPLPHKGLRHLSAVTLLLGILLGVEGCALLSPEAGVGRAVRWGSLAGWQDDNLQEGWQALSTQCLHAGQQPGVVHWCAAVAELPQQPSTQQLREFFESKASPYPLHAAYGRRKGMITGYYEPLLQGALSPDERYRYPLYRVPDSLLVIDMAEMFPELEGKRVRGRVEGHKVVPYYSREQIDATTEPLAGQELFWVDDPVGAFFLHIQGSGIVELPDGSRRGVAYGQQNGHPYRAIGRDLIEQGEIAAEDISLFSIRDWLENNPNKAQALMNRNPSYVFFSDSGEVSSAGPHGSLGVPLTAGRSVAVDRTVVPLGSPLWLETTLADGSAYRRLVFAQDTGGAIAGAVRADVFFGRGTQAAQRAGTMKQKGRMYLLQLKKPGV